MLRRDCSRRCIAFHDRRRCLFAVGCVWDGCRGGPDQLGTGLFHPLDQLLQPLRVIRDGCIAIMDAEIEMDHVPFSIA